MFESLTAITPKALPLSQFEYKLTQPNGTVEEGLFEHILDVIKPIEHFCIELGAGDGSNYSFTRRLIEDRAYGAYLNEGNPALAKKLAAKFDGSRRVQASAVRITRENALDLLEESDTPKSPALLAIDINGNDFYVWQALIDRITADVVSIKFNGSFGPDEEFLIPYRADFHWSGDDYFGASFKTLVNFGEAHGYRLVHCTSAGDNLIFVKKEFAHHFASTWLSPRALYQLPQYGKNGRAPNGKGHPASTQNTSAIERIWYKTRYALMTVPRKLVYASHDPKGHNR